MVYLVDRRGPDRVRGRRRHPQPGGAQLIRDISLPVGVGLFGHAIASGRGRRLGRLPAGQALPAFAGRRSDRDDRQHALHGRGAADRGGRGARRARRLLVAHRRLRRGGDRAAPGAGRPRGGGDRQPAAHRAAGAIPGGAGAPRRGATHARRDLGQDRRDPRSPGRSCAVGGRRRSTAPRLRRRAPHAHADGWASPATDGGGRRQSPRGPRTGSRSSTSRSTGGSTAWRRHAAR